MAVEAVWEMIGKEFPDTEYCRKLSLLRTKSKDNVGTASAMGQPPDIAGS